MKRLLFIAAGCASILTACGNEGNWLVGRWTDDGEGTAGCARPDVEFLSNGRAIADGQESRWELKGDQLIVTRNNGRSRSMTARPIDQSRVSVDGSVLTRCP
ncbi:MAG TPA: hypothetical protein VF603_08205 [Allosphingosinicella sp.]|jgi:hypothetical protein